MVNGAEERFGDLVCLAVISDVLSYCRCEGLNLCLGDNVSCYGDYDWLRRWQCKTLLLLITLWQSKVHVVDMHTKI